MPKPMSTIFGTVVIYSHAKLVLKFRDMYIKISRFRLILLSEPLGKTGWRPGSPTGRMRGDTGNGSSKVSVVYPEETRKPVLTKFKRG